MFVLINLDSGSYIPIETIVYNEQRALKTDSIQQSSSILISPPLSSSPGLRLALEHIRKALNLHFSNRKNGRSPISQTGYLPWVLTKCSKIFRVVKELIPLKFGDIFYFQDINYLKQVCDLGNLLRNIVNLILLFCDHSTLSYAAYNMPPCYLKLVFLESGRDNLQDGTKSYISR